MNLREKLREYISQLENQKENILNGPFYTDFEYALASGKESILEDIISDLEKLIE